MGDGSLPSAVVGSVRVLLVSSVIDNVDALAAAAKESALVVSYDAEHTILEGLLRLLEEALAGRKAGSIGIAAHDYGEARFYLCGWETISLASTLSSESQREFWKGLVATLSTDGHLGRPVCLQTGVYRKLYFSSIIITLYKPCSPALQLV